jgi:OmpA-OmpF porin, OOP family
MRCSLCGLLIIISFNLSAQNLVPNPGFEELVRCPSTFSANRNDFMVPGWQSPTSGTPDHFHGCSWGEADVPFNWAGNSNAHSGKAYAGIYVWNTRDDYREYLQCELAEPLKAGEKYLLEFYYKLANNAVYAINRIGLNISETPVNAKHDRVLNISPVISIEQDTAITKTTGMWEHVRQEYTAKGGERYVIIGNFFGNDKTKFTRLPFRYGMNAMLNFNAYYYIDDVSVKNLDSLKNVIPTVAPVQLNTETIELNKDYTLKDIKFEFDSYVIHKSSNDELNKVVAYLHAHPEVHARLSGHTDFIGSDDYNLTLSRNRARSVADFLIAKGIQPQRVVSFGFGKSRPLSTEKTNDARAINRRVEIRFEMQ